MRLITTSLYIIVAALAVGIATPSEAADRDPKSNEASAKPSSNHIVPTNPDPTKQEIVETSETKLSEK